MQDKVDLCRVSVQAGNTHLFVDPYLTLLCRSRMPQLDPRHPQSSMQCMTAAFRASPVPDGSLGTPRSCSTPTPEMSTGSLSTCSLVVKSSISFPSPCTVNGTDDAKSAFKLLAMILCSSSVNRVPVYVPRINIIAKTGCNFTYSKCSFPG